MTDMSPTPTHVDRIAEGVFAQMLRECEPTSAARRWMHVNAEEYRVRDGISCTSLAEACAEALGLFTDHDGTIPNWLFAAAVTVEAATGTAES